MLSACLKATGPMPGAAGEHRSPWERPAGHRCHCHASATTQASSNNPAAIRNGKQRRHLPAWQWRRRQMQAGLPQDGEEVRHGGQPLLGGTWAILGFTI